MQEVWRPIKGFEEKFEISNLGRVKSLARVVSNHTGVIHKPERLMKPRLSAKGYAVISLDDKYRQIHRLVALAFIPNPLNKPQVNHIDGNKQNNCVDNLEWCTNQENALHAVRTGLNDHSKYHSGRPYKPVLQIDKNTQKVIAEFKSIADAKKAISPNSKHNNIGACCRGERHEAFGFKWRFKNAG